MCRAGEKSSDDLSVVMADRDQQCFGVTRSSAWRVPGRCRLAECRGAGIARDWMCARLLQDVVVVKKDGMKEGRKETVWQRDISLPTLATLPLVDNAIHLIVDLESPRSPALGSCYEVKPGPVSYLGFDSASFPSVTRASWLCLTLRWH